MGEKRFRKERRREAPKPTEKLAPIQVSTDKAVAMKQRSFCKALVDEILEDESALSFSKPVDELWDMEVLTDYFEKIKRPMDLGTVRKTVASGGYVADAASLFDPNLFRFDLRLVFLNAIEYNGKGTDLYRLASKFLQHIDSKILDLPGLIPPSSEERDTAMPQAPAQEVKAPPHVQDRENSQVTGSPNEAGKDAAQSEANAASAEGTNPAMEDVSGVPDKTDQEQPMHEEEERLRTVISNCTKHRSRAEAALAEMELLRNVRLSHQESVRLRDEVENLPWETAKKVVKILRQYVDEALTDSKDDDPEFVTLELSTVEPRLLRDIESLIRPDPKEERERATVERLTAEIKDAERTLRALTSSEQGVKKKPRRRR